jgi:pyruvate dehydrogenase E2 component (dihydrolipoamide acetyltransferase)
MAEVVMPRLSDSMEEGTIVRWLKRDGDPVAQGEPLAEVETDKATVTFDADADGTLHILVAEGQTVALGTLIARIGDAGTVDGKAAPTSTGNGSHRVNASPLARRIARESGIDLSMVAGTGPGGRIVKADLDAVAGQAPGPGPEPEPERKPESVSESAASPAPAAAPAPAEPPAPVAATRGNKGPVTSQQLSRTQVQIAQRMAESRATIPDFTLEAEVDMQQAVALREQLRRARATEIVPSYNDMVVKACAMALREHPRANAAYRDGAFELYGRVNVGIAVAAQDSLIVPTVFDADGKTLLEIAHEARGLAERVRQRTVTPAELSGATFTVSNLGMYGVANFAAIINPPQAAILAVGEVREVPVVREGQLVPGVRMSATLTCDHRILYGAPAAEFLARIRQLLEQPINLLV